MNKKLGIAALLVFGLVCACADLIDKSGIQISRQLAIDEKQKEQDARRQKILENSKVIAESKELKEKLISMESELLREKIENKLLHNLCKKNKIDTTTVSAYVSEIMNCPKSFELPLSVGQIAFLGDTTTCKVSQVIDASNLIATISIKSKGGYTTKTVWLSNISTEGLTDDAIVGYVWPMKITGTKSYGTVLGASNTVFILEPVLP
jgi:hypothetical protein